MSSGFGESVGTQVVSKRMVKRQQMEWSQSGPRSYEREAVIFPGVAQTSCSGTASSTPPPNYVRDDQKFEGEAVSKAADTG
jgi:hypothetical protein